MNSSDIINNSKEENSKIIDTSEIDAGTLDDSVQNSINTRTSFGDVVDDSYSSDDINKYNSKQDFNVEVCETPSPKTHSFVSSDEDERFQAITKSSKKTRIRRIASDSEDELDLVESNEKTNNDSIDESFTNMEKSIENVNVSNVKNTSKEPEKLTMNDSYRENNQNISSDSSDDDENSEDYGNKSKNTSKDHGNKSINDSFRANVQNISSDKSENDVICVTSEDDEAASVSVHHLETKNGTKLQQTTLDSMVNKMSLAGAGDAEDSKSNAVYCSAAEYANQSSKVANLRTDIARCKNILRNANLPTLPDKGALLIQRHRNLEQQLLLEDQKLKKMVVNYVAPENPQKTTWEQLQANSAYVVPNTVGKQAMNTFSVQKTLTMDRLKNLHDSLATCPDDDTLAEDPKGLKVELMRHQKRALAWLMWREAQKPSGGILADDMGLGKTLTMISLILATKEAEIEDHESESDSDEKASNSKWTSNRKFKVEGGTLVVCPATLLKQWECEIDNKLKRNLLSTELYHGAKRETRASRLAKYDVVITTYKLVQGEFEKNGPLYNIKWKRVILDEGHVIRNPKSQTSVAACALKAKARWVLTGTPVHNKELDLYALLKFLRCSPFDDLGVWKRWVANKNAGGQDRLNTVVTSILLRRTKAQLQTQGNLNSLPEKKFEIIEVALDSMEKQLYQKVLIFSRTLFIEFLRQRAEKNPEFTNVKGGDLTQTNDAEYNKMHKKVMQMHGNTAVKSHEILVLLLRLRQICCHPSLISSMLDKEDCTAEGIEDDEGVDVDMLDKLNNLNLDDENDNPTTGEAESFNTAANKILSSSNPVFSTDRANEKLRVIQKIIEEKVIPNDDKIIIVSQWTSMLNVIMCHLKDAKIKCDILDGKVPVHKRNDIVVNFNSSTSKIKVLLLSLTAGGVGLNLVGANHLLLVDLHWNPQLESQAQDRIYRVGQKKTVFVYKIVTSETIEERIKALQDRKLNLASDLLSGVRPGAGSKLSLDDLKMLFNI